MDRNIPKHLDIILGKSFLGVHSDEKLTPELYLKNVMDYEIKFEKELINILERLRIWASVKTERYSLPYQEEIKVVKIVDKHPLFRLNDPYREVLKAILKDILIKEIQKFRFYFLVDFENNEQNSQITIIYRMRYYVHD
ncbi:hypothetical protein PBAC_19470 [Pedobacter glucosidilyticus]|nr:hypothetical protein [Pedobacter glucosidilyticus]KHJ37787.1 hypothetical protein PBAC_19470 [Pedobacter glucosidilyticus]